MKVYLGIDLAGVEHRESGYCILDENDNVLTGIIYKDCEIVELARKTTPEVIAIDAPLALPKGKTIDSKKCIRECDRKLTEMGIKFFPINFAGMRYLTLRGIRVRKMLEKEGFTVVETYPGAFYDILKIPRAKRDFYTSRKTLIEKFNLKNVPENLSVHELDAIACALAAKMYDKGTALKIGDPTEILMILPDPRHF
ncbi:MAG TPA: DUF429 domain-containing protein [Candidatus Bathyarchaeota archaeon]|nr:DUF429 domain-containing protein [Candidatus Bathyarchaeota archaeon]